jgi:alpha-glucoside transport system substrate-binding protein
MGSVEGVQRISPNVGVGVDCYSDPIVGTISGSIVDALKGGGARFDASELMPPAVGSGSFWTGMNEWMRGADMVSVFADIEASWPAE